MVIGQYSLTLIYLAIQNQKYKNNGLSVAPQKGLMYLQKKILKNQLIDHLIITKQPECFPRFDGYPKSIIKLTLNKPSINMKMSDHYSRVFTMVVYEKIYFEAYTNDQYIWHKILHKYILY